MLLRLVTFGLSAGHCIEQLGYDGHAGDDRVSASGGRAFEERGRMWFSVEGKEFEIKNF